jgi:hypothetical protein
VAFTAATKSQLFPEVTVPDDPPGLAGPMLFPVEFVYVNTHDNTFFVPVLICAPFTE